MGGAFEFYAKNSLVDNCTFINNYACGYLGTQGEGGAFNLYAYADYVTVSNCYFLNNRATKAGGAIASVSSSCKYTDVINCTFVGNSASEGGAIKYSSDSTNMTNCLFINNTATVDGGAICSQAKNSWVKYCEFDGNSAKDGMDFYEHSGCDINFLYLIVRNIFVGNDDLTGKIAKGHGLNSKDPVNWAQAMYYLNLREIYSNVTIYLVGSITNFSEKTIASPFNEIIIKTHAENIATVNLNGWNHRAFTVTANNIVIRDLTFINSDIQSSGDGGVLKIVGSNITLDNCTFRNNKAINGGAIYFVEGYSDNSVSNSIFTNNGASQIGGAIYNSADSTSIDNSQFTTNTASVHPTVYSSTDISIENSEMDNQLILSLSDVSYGQGAPVSGLFNSTKNAPETVYVYVNNDSFEVTKYNTTVSFTVENVTFVNDNATITAVLENETDGIVSIFVLEREYDIEVINGTGSIQIPIEKDGLITVKGSFDGNYKYFQSEVSEVMFNVSKRDANVSVEVSDVLVGEDVNVNVIVAPGATGNVSVTVNNKTKSLALGEDGKLQFTFEDIPVGTYPVEVTYEGDYQYNSTFNDSESVTVTKVESELKVDIPEVIHVGDDAVVSVEVKPADATGTVTVEVNGFSANATLKDGKATVTVPSSYLPEGNYTVDVTYSGDENTTAKKASSSLAVEYLTAEDLQKLIDDAVANNQTEVNLTNDYRYLENETAVKIPSNITVNGNGHTIDAQNNSGIFNVTGDNVVINDVVLTNGNATEGGAIYWDGDNGTLANTTITDSSAESGAAVFVNGNNTTVTNSTFKNNTGNDGSNAIAVNGKDLAIDIDNETYANSDGPVKNIVTKLNATASKGYEGYESVVITVNTNADDGDIYVTINGKKYHGTVKYGVGTITIPDLPAGEYNDVVVNYVNNENYTSKSTTVDITVLEGKPNIINSDVTKDYNSGYIYKALIIGVDGKPVGAGIPFKIDINGKIKTYKTDAKGYIKIKLDKSYIPGKYTIKLSWKGVKTKHVITVKQILKTKKSVTIKKSAYKLVLKASLKNSKGKAIKYKKITFKVKGKTYTAKTNKYGVAKITINKNMIKKFKAGKTYTVKITYLKDTIKSYIKVKK